MFSNKQETVAECWQLFPDASSSCYYDHTMNDTVWKDTAEKSQPLLSSFSLQEFNLMSYSGVVCRFNAAIINAPVVSLL